MADEDENKDNDSNVNGLEELFILSHRKLFKCYHSFIIG